MTAHETGHLDVDHAEIALHLRDGSIVHMTNVQAVGTIVPHSLSGTDPAHAEDVPSGIAWVERLDITLTGFAWPDPETGRVAAVHMGDPEDAAGALAAAHAVLEGLARHGTVYSTNEQAAAEEAR